MLTYVDGDLFSSPAQVLVNTVNTVGVMGKGIAKEFKAIYPEMFNEYQRLCEQGRIAPGVLFLYKTQNKWILNFPTKRHWRQKSRIEDIDAGLRTFVRDFVDSGITSISFPQLGCGNGELDWERDVRPLMERYLGALPLDVFIHIYDGTSVLPEHRDRARMLMWLRQEPTALPFLEFLSDLLNEYDKDAPGYQLAESDIDESGADDVLLLGDRQIGRMELFDIWQRFRTSGYLGVGDLQSLDQAVGRSLLEHLAKLPYVEAAAFGTIADAREMAADSTRQLLGSERSKGVRLVPSLMKRGIGERVDFSGQLEAQLCLAGLETSRS